MKRLIIIPLAAILSVFAGHSQNMMDVNIDDYTLELKDDGHLYQFSYRIAGRILNEATPNRATEAWGEVRCCHEPYPYGAPDFPTPHFDLEFWVTLPWVLDI